jgi:N-acetylmuramoyl-L-alanine amidase
MNIKAICLEAGHGKPIYNFLGKVIGFDTGATTICNGVKYTERDLVVDLAKKVIAKLQGKAGLQIFPVGVDTNADLTKKTNYINSICQQFGADGVLSVSLHYNAASIPSARGSEIYFQSNGKSLTLANAFLKTFQDYAVFPLRPNPVKSSATDRFGRLYIDDLACRAVLLEPAFISNSDDMSAILGQSDRIAESIAHCILNLPENL